MQSVLGISAGVCLLTEGQVKTKATELCFVYLNLCDKIFMRWKSTNRTDISLKKNVSIPKCIFSVNMIAHTVLTVYQFSSVKCS